MLDVCLKLHAHPPQPVVTFELHLAGDLAGGWRYNKKADH